MLQARNMATWQRGRDARAVAQVVKHGDFVAGLQQQKHGVAADITSTASHQNRGINRCRLAFVGHAGNNSGEEAGGGHGGGGICKRGRNELHRSPTTFITNLP